ncbi:fasciclin domain-containing protein [Neptuniibacter sp. CAU 1671]|uniref:fasciclin domain-containing protein n=1 Tax=Neptuniibacter sp. CAU 1671 TaxID=3032593 RepID=UPI0023DC4C30|nr:fasciclin domain-containing protein [Neptuniibacter sp. CAU 1671]MDF2182514.1 fasciclin domain-containing protein [Neptuniibacter sp. CAU 1671]
MKKIMALAAGLVISGSALAGNCKSEGAASIVDIAVNDDRFEILVQAVTAFGLANDLNTNRNFTVFAPTDDAFKAIGFAIETELGDVLNPELTDEQLSAVPNILLYHVAYGSRDSEEIFAKDKMQMLNKAFVELDSDGVSFNVNDAQVLIPDIEACNGYVHVIDSVLLPPTEES